MSRRFLSVTSTRLLAVALGLLLVGQSIVATVAQDRHPLPADVVARSRGVSVRDHHPCGGW